MFEQAHRLFDLEPNFFGTYWMLGLAHWSQGMHDAAVAELRKAVQLGGGPVPLADLGCLLGRLDRKPEAQQVLEELKELGMTKPLTALLRAWNTKTVALRISENTASAVV